MITDPKDTQRKVIRLLDDLGFYHEAIRPYLNQGYYIRSVSAALKEAYKSVSDNLMKDLIYKDNPFLKLMPKDNVTGQHYKVPVEYGKKGDK